MQSWAELGRILNVDPAQLVRESKRPGFPIDGGVELIKSWRILNIKPRDRKSKQTTTTPPPSIATDLDLEPLASESDPFILDLMNGVATPIALTKAAMQMASRRVAKGAVKGTLSANDLDGLKKTLQELRQSEEAYINLEESKKNLIKRSDVELLIGQCVNRLLVCLETITNTMANELSIWLTSPEIAAMNQDDRARKVREFVGKVCRDVRGLDAAAVDKMIVDIGRDDE